MARRFYDTTANPRNFVAIWDRLHDLSDSHAAHATMIAAQQATIAQLQSDLARTAQQSRSLASQVINPPAGGAAGPNAGGQPAPGGGTAPPPIGADAHPNHQAQIAAAMNELIALGQSVAGYCGCLAILRRALPGIQASDPSAGFAIAKPGSANTCEGFTTDVICYPDGVVYDCLTQSEADTHSATWGFAGTVDVTRYRNHP